MRIIAGKYRSRRVNTISSGKGDCIKNNIIGFRPTTDRAKETLFNVLNNVIDFDSINCLDLFAGSGSLGFEALSRGAAGCDFVESSMKQVKSIEKTSFELGCKENISIYCEDVIKFLLESGEKYYDLVFADPPYAYENYADLSTEIFKLKFSIMVFEYGNSGSIFYNIKEYDIIDKKVGVTNFKIFISKD